MMMKKRKAVWASFLIFIFSCSCKQNDQGKIFKVFQPEYHFTKPVNAKLYTNGYYKSYAYTTGGYSEFQSLYLNSDTSFTFYNNPDMVSVGTWHLTKDTVVLIPYSLRKSIISYNLKLSKTSTRPFVTFIIYDKTNHPIPNFLIQPFNNHPPYRYDSTGQLVLVKQGTNKLSGFPENYTTDSTGTVKFKKRQYDSLDFTKLSFLTRKKFTISTNNLPDTIKLVININGIALSEKGAYLTNASAIPFPQARLLLRGDRFIAPFD